MKYINEDSKFWKHSYRVHLSEYDTDGLLVNADHEQNALDCAIDYAESKGWMGLFIDEPTEKDRENLLSGGNHCLVLSSENVTITQLD